MSKCALASLILLVLQDATAWARPWQIPLPTSSTSFANGGKMPAKLGCDGANLSPDIRLPTPPADTLSFAVEVEDPDAPATFVHWLAYGIPPGTRELPEGASTPSQRLEQAAEGTNSFGQIGYGGPCPLAGSTHHYVFHVYALDTMPALPSGASAQRVSATIQGHVLAEGRMTGLYARD